MKTKNLFYNIQFLINAKRNFIIVFSVTLKITLHLLIIDLVVIIKKKKKTHKNYTMSF